MRATLAIGAVELRRFLRDRGNIFFVFIFPMLLVLLIGIQFGGAGGQGRAAVAGDPGELRSALVSALENGDVTVTITDADSARELLARGQSDAGIIIPAAAESAYAAGETLSVEVIRGNQPNAPATYQQVATAVRSLTTERGQLIALTDAGIPAGEAGAALAAAGQRLEAPTLDVVDVDRIAQEFGGVSGFSVGAAGEVLLFVFLISLAGSASLIQARRNGVIARTMAAPVSATGAFGGLALGRYTIAVFQGVYIIVATLLLFQVDWGNIWLSLLVLVLFAAVSAGAAMVLGSVMDNEGAASGVGVGLGLVLAALGGCMIPLELFPDTLRTIAHITPHAWGYDAFAQIQRHDGTLLDILPELAVLAAMALALLAVGTWALRRSVARAV